jgi:hypothetical protein
MQSGRDTVEPTLPNPRLTWALVIAATWASSLWLTYQAGFRPGLTIPPATIPPLPYPWVGVGRVALQTAAYAIVAYFIVRRGGPRRAALGLVAALSTFVIHSMTFGTDAPDFVYMPMRYSLMLTVVILVVLAFGFFGAGPAAARKDAASP